MLELLKCRLGPTTVGAAVNDMSVCNGYNPQGSLCTLSRSSQEFGHRISRVVGMGQVAGLQGSYLSGYRDVRRVKTR